MIYCVYSLADGTIRARFDTSPDLMRDQVGKEEEIFEGDADPSLYFIDLETKEPRLLRDRDPGDGSTWSESESRWITPAEHNLRIGLEIESLEAKQARPMRELAIDSKNSAARTMLGSIDAQITELRTKRIV
jgi:hypothetical protein